MDLAVAVIIAGAFALITASLVGDIIMPIVGWIFGGLDFSNYFIPLGEGVTATSLEAAKELYFQLLHCRKSELSILL